jgi:hypothetical protein
MSGGFSRTAVRQYLECYDQERPHQGLGNEITTASSEECLLGTPVKAKERFGGHLNYYYRQFVSNFLIVWSCIELLQNSHARKPTPLIICILDLRISKLS